MNRLILISVFLMTQLLSTICTSQNLNLGNFKYTYLGIEQGASNNFITDIYQDQKGFIWVGTYDGLNRYDGYDFITYRNQPHDSTSLSNNRVVTIYNSNNEIWVGTKMGVSVYDYNTSKFSVRYSVNLISNKKEKIDCPINKINGLGNYIYLATAGKGLLYKKDKDVNLNKIPLKYKGKLLWDYYAQDIAFDNRKRMWVFVQGVGICLYDVKSKWLKPVFTEILSGNCMVIDRDNSIWVGLDNGLLKYNISKRNYFLFSNEEIRFVIKDIIYLPKDNKIWLGTDGNGLWEYNIIANKFKKINVNEGDKLDSNNSIYALFNDNANRKWVGTLRGGISVLSTKKLQFNTISKINNFNNSLVSNYILSFYEINKEKIWIGTDGYGISLWDRTTNAFKNYKHEPLKASSLSNNFVTSIEATKKGYWFATYGGGINLFDAKSNTFKKYRLYNKKLNSYQDNVWRLYKDSKGVLWVATPSGEGGLYKYDSINDKFDFIDIGISGIISLLSDHNGNMWIGTYSDLVRLDFKTNSHKIFKIGVPIRDIVEESNGNILFGTEGDGLLRLNIHTNNIHYFTEVDGLPNNSVLKIVKDNHSQYWLSTYNGLSKFNPLKNTFKNYFKGDGLQSNQFNYNAGLKLSTGEILMGGINGFSIINPKYKSMIYDFPKLLLTDIKVNNKSITNEGKTVFGVNEIELPFDNSMLSIIFSALEYDRPDKIEYAYFLEGWDKDWHYVGNRREAYYSKLYDGEYTLKIKSTNADGIWNKKITTLSIVILPPWYRSIFAYFIYLTAFSMGLYGIFYYYRKQERLKFKILFAEKMAKKEREHSEKKFNFFASISHEFRSPLTMIINPLKDIFYSKNDQINLAAIEVAYRNSQRLLSLVDQFLLFRKAGDDDETFPLKISKLEVVALFKEVFTCFVYQASSNGIQFDFECNEKEIFIYADQQKLEMTFFNLISNAIKFTNKVGGKVKVKIVSKSNEVYISVSDNGIGVADYEKEKIFDLFFQSSGNIVSKKKGFGIGLYLVKQFVKQHHGKVLCVNNKSGGATFKFALLKGREHFGNGIISDADVENEIEFNEFLNANESNDSFIVEELEEESFEGLSDNVVYENKMIFIVDDNIEVRKYLKQILSDQYHIFEAKSVEEAQKLLKLYTPDLIITDVVMDGASGVDFCVSIKESDELKHIPVILLTASTSETIKLKGAESGADDYIIKPFDKDYLLARVKGLLNHQKVLQDYLLNVVTKQPINQKLSDEDRILLDNFIEIIDNNIDNSDFSTKTLALEMRMSTSLMYKKIKKITGQPAGEFIRHLKLRRVAKLLITTDIRIGEAAELAGFKDMKFFRKQFKLKYNINPSEFKQKYKKSMLDKKFMINEK